MELKVLTQLGNLFRQTDQNMADSLKDPVRDAGFAIEDAQKEIDDFRTQIHELMTNTQDLKKQLINATADVEKFDGFAKAAAGKGNREDVVEAVTSRQRAQGLVDTLTKAITANEEKEKTFQQQIADRMTQIANAETNKARLAATLASNQIREKSAKAAVQIGQKSKGLQALDELQRQVDHADSSAAAWEKLQADTPEAKQQSLEAKYGSANADVDGEVDRLMKAAAPGATTAA